MEYNRDEHKPKKLLIHNYYYGHLIILPNAANHTISYIT